MNPFLRFLSRSLTGEGKLFVGDPDHELFNSPGGLQKSIDGGVVASVAGVMPAPQAYITVVSGALAITGITVPYPGFAGTICYIPTGAFTWTVATNIALAGTAVVGKALFFTYLPSTGKWYPSYTA
jgi:hypothetical protein